ncbi:hypothetical protein GLV94_02865 [Virgibacillus halodenitrificans]|uniref:N-acetylmuramoyl-L-alanine amidase n=1 Tax=Virgibacillus halodenitrificans TaxID=1482 RepID=UPI00136BA1A5|nr:N-acetylmuramoyl-L-alanine amidase [Virgibacillus halodenitrificans]MYL44575.1 hypothetical protein [Virgibacillus halodenitrificans]
MTTIAIDIGHGSNTFPPSKGVYNNGKAYHEHEFNAKVAIELDKLLKHNGFITVMKQKPFKADVPLRTRTDYYNSIGVDLVWSIHANANSNDHVEGRCAFYWVTSKGGKRLAQLYVDECNRAGFATHGNGLHASERGSWTDLHIPRETRMVAVLTENGFMTNDRPGIDDDFELLFGVKQGQYVKDIAKVHARAICRYFGKEFRDLDTNVVKPSKPQTKPETITKPSGGYSGTSVVDYLNHIKKDSSFSARKKYAKEYGISNYKGTASQNLTLLKNMKAGKKLSKPTSNKKYVYLPSSAKTWRTYKLNVQPVKKNSDWSLTPARYGGLKYEILDEPYPNVVTIKTGRGKRNIYVGPGTSAVIK